MSDDTTQALIRDAEGFLADRPIGWKVTSGFESLERLDDLDGDANYAVTYESGETWCGGIAEGADFLVNALGWEPE